MRRRVDHGEERTDADEAFVGNLREALDEATRRAEAYRELAGMWKQHAENVMAALAQERAAVLVPERASSARGTPGAARGGGG